MKRIFAVWLAAAAAVLLFNLSPASAHDAAGQLSPANGSTVAAGAFEVSISFAENIMQAPDNSGLIIEVTGPAGSDSKLVSNACVTVDGKKLSTPVDLDLAGNYQVVWRSVSSDGHATEGKFEFTVVNDSNYVSSGIPAISEQCSSYLVVAQSPDPSASASDLPLSKDSKTFGVDTNVIGLGLSIFFVILGAAAGPILAEIKKKRAKTKAEKN